MLLITLQAAGGGGLLGQLPFLAIMIAIIYFFFIRPSAKRQREQQDFIKKLDKGQEIVTNSGIIGRIKSIDEKEIQLQVSEKNFIRITRGSVSAELTQAFQKPEDSKKS